MRKPCWIAYVLAALAVGVSLVHAEVATVRLSLLPGSAGAGGPQRKPGAVPTAYVVKTDAAPVIDGKTGDACWSKGERLTMTFTLDGEGRASVPTEVRLLRDAGTLYVAFHCFEPFVAKMRPGGVAHDADLWNDDSVEVFLGTGTSYCHFIINSKGTTYDAAGKERNWESRFRAAAVVGKRGWTAEAAIPLQKVARKKPIPKQWIANFTRNRYAGGRWEELAWSPTMTGDSHVPGRFGALKFEAPPAKRVVKPKTGVKPRVGGVLLACEGGEGVVRFDLSRLPAKARIYRADLHVARSKPLSGKDDEALVNTEVIPLFDAFQEGGAPKARAKPLAVRGPWFDRLDATEAVKAWGAGKANGGFFVRALPLWKREGTRLEILYEGAPKKVPPAASGLGVAHRAGQTFITWKEIADPVGQDNVTWGDLRRVLDRLSKQQEVRYCIYRSDKPITPKTLHKAEWIATVAPLSCWNINGRNIERPIDLFMQQYALRHGQWSPFWGGEVDGKFGLDCPIDRFVIADGSKPLPRGSGLYVHTPITKGKAYYAVVTSVDGVQNTVELSDANSLKRPIAETPAQPKPVLQGKMPPRPFNNYDETRLHYVQWTAPPMGNLPSQYYNWSVAVPLELKKGCPMELSLHRPGLAYWRTQYRIETNSVVLTPYDFPVNTGWHGYHEAMGTLKSFKQGAIHNYTERRLLAFIDWAAREWPVDRDRILVTAIRGYSCSAALHLAFRHRDVFNMVLVGYGFADYRTALQIDARTERKGAVPDMERLWGKIAWDLKTDQGKSVWDDNNITQMVRDAPARTEWPLVTIAGTYFYQSSREFFSAMLAKKQPIITYFNQWGGKMQPVTTSGNWTNMIYEDVRKDLSLPAFRGPEAAQLDKDARRYVTALNLAMRWDTADIVDQPGRYEITLRRAGRRDATTDVTLRRLQKFKVARGRSYAWQFNPTVPDRRAKPQNGQITVPADGLITIPGLKIPGSGGRLVVTPK